MKKIYLLILTCFFYSSCDKSITLQINGKEEYIYNNNGTNLKIRSSYFGDKLFLHFQFVSGDYKISTDSLKLFDMNNQLIEFKGRNLYDVKKRQEIDGNNIKVNSPSSINLTLTLKTPFIYQSKDSVFILETNKFLKYNNNSILEETLRLTLVSK